jgi:hypothetical protein
MRPDAAWLSANLIPPRREMVRQYLAYLTNRERWAAAAAEARKILPAAEAEDGPELLAYGEARLSRGDVSEAAEIWNALCRRRLLAVEPLDPAGGRLVTNGDFRLAPSGRGFDWHPIEQPGVRAVAESGELRVGFAGSQPEHCPIAWQYVPTAPGTRYRLQWEARAGGGEPARDIAWDVGDAGMQVESAGSLVFVAAKDPARIYLIYERPLGSARLEGTVWIGRVRLERAQ